MPDYSLREAQRLLHTDNKGLQRWMEEAGGMKARQDKRNKSRWLLSWEQIQVLAAAHGRALPAEPPPPAADPLAALRTEVLAQLAGERRAREQEIRALRQHIDGLQQQFDALRQEGEREALSLRSLPRSEPPQGAVPASAESAPHEGRRRGPTAENAGLSQIRLFLTLHGATHKQVHSWPSASLPRTEREALRYAAARVNLKRCGNAACVCRDEVSEVAAD